MSANAEDADPAGTEWSDFLGLNLPYRDKKQLDEKDWCQEFLKLYARSTGTTWKIRRKSERPDFICSDGNRTIGVEISEVVGEPTPELNIKKLDSTRAKLERTVQTRLRQHERWAALTGSWRYVIVPSSGMVDQRPETLARALVERFWKLPRPGAPIKEGLPPEKEPLPPGIDWVWIEESPDGGGPRVTVWISPFGAHYPHMSDFTERLDAIVRRHSGSFGSLPDGAEGILVLTADFVSAEGRLFEQAARQWECPQMPGLRECYLLRGYNPDKGYELFPVRVDKRLSGTENGHS